MAHPFFKHPLVKRLPFLILVAVGLLIWRTGYLPHQRDLVFDVPQDPTIREIDVQIYQGDDLIKRETFFLPNGPQGSLESHLSIGRGHYSVRTWVKRDGRAPESGDQPLEVRGEDVVSLSLLPR